MTSRACDDLAFAILASLPRRFGVTWLAEPDGDGVILRCVIGPGQASARVTSLDEARAEASRLMVAADAAAIAALMDENADDEEPVIFAGVYWRYRDYLREIAPYCELPCNDDLEEIGSDGDEAGDR